MGLILPEFGIEHTVHAAESNGSALSCEFPIPWRRVGLRKPRPLSAARVATGLNDPEQRDTVVTLWHAG